MFVHACITFVPIGIPWFSIESACAIKTEWYVLTHQSRRIWYSDGRIQLSILATLFYTHHALTSTPSQRMMAQLQSQLENVMKSRAVVEAQQAQAEQAAENIVCHPCTHNFLILRFYNFCYHTMLWAWLRADRCNISTHVHWRTYVMFSSTYAHAHTRTHVHMHTCTHAHTHTRTHAHTQTRIHAYTLTHLHPPTPTSISINTMSRAHILMHTHAHIVFHTQIHAHDKRAMLKKHEPTIDDNPTGGWRDCLAIQPRPTNTEHTNTQVCVCVRVCHTRTHTTIIIIHTHTHTHVCVCVRVCECVCVCERERERERVRECVRECVCVCVCTCVYV